MPRMSIGLVCIVLLSWWVLAANMVYPSESQSGSESNLLLLQNDSIVVGILPHAGGRIVLLRRPGGENILLSDPDLWKPADQTPEPSADSNFVKFNGHETWMGPQQDWWIHQAVNPTRAASKAVWPPDPWMNLGRFEIVNHQCNSVTLSGPPSPVSGLQLTKEISIASDGTVSLKTTAKNIRNEPVSWDLWSLTRLPNRSYVYAPSENESSCRIESAKNDSQQMDVAPHLVRDGVFAFDANAAFPEGKTDLVAKAYLNPPIAWMAGFSGGCCIFKKMANSPGEKVHPAQAAIEIYVDITNPPKSNGMIEMEFHSEYRTLLPGEVLTMEESWKVIPYKGPASVDSHIEFLKTQGILKTEK